MDCQPRPPIKTRPPAKSDNRSNRSAAAKTAALRLAGGFFIA